MTFKEKWLEAVDKNNSVLCAGVDPAEFSMGRGSKGLPEGVTTRDWGLKYVEAVAPYCAAVKPNLQYWKNLGGMKTLQEIVDLSHEKGLVVIDDSKLADIGSTNEAGIFYSKRKGFDAVTLALFAGNIEEAAKQADDWKIGGIHMCLMSNPEYAAEKNKLIDVTLTASEYDAKNVLEFNGKIYVPQYISLAHRAKKSGLDGIVIGAPSQKNHISQQEILTARQYAGNNMLVLLPEVGAQGGEADAIWKAFDRNYVIVNVGRSMMFPNGSNSTPEQQAHTAKYYQKMLNGLRTD